jgi:hypothetical protein
MPRRYRKLTHYPVAVPLAREMSAFQKRLEVNHSLGGCRYGVHQGRGGKGLKRDGV